MDCFNQKMIPALMQLQFGRGDAAFGKRAATDFLPDELTVEPDLEGVVRGYLQSHDRQVGFDQEILKRPRTRYPKAQIRRGVLLWHESHFAEVKPSIFDVLECPWLTVDLFARSKVSRFIKLDDIE